MVCKTKKFSYLLVDPVHCRIYFALVLKGGAASPKIDFCSLGKKSFEIDFHVRHENNILQNVYN